MSKLTTIILFLIVLGGGYHYYQVNYVRYNYEGATEPGYAYPDKAREDFLDECYSGLVEGQENNPKPFRIAEEDIPTICECMLNAFEEKYSYKEFDQNFDNVGVGLRAKVMKHAPKEIKEIYKACVSKSGYRLL